MKTCFGCAGPEGSVDEHRPSDSMLLAVLTCTQCSSDAYYTCDSSDSDVDTPDVLNENACPSPLQGPSVKPILDYRFTTPFTSPLFA